MNKSVVLLLDNIRSAYNVGAIFRTADAVRVDKIYLLGSTPTPVDRFGRPQAAIHKTALGADETVAWEHVGTATERSTGDGLRLVKNLQADGYRAVMIEQVPGSTTLADYQPAEKVLYILGAEVEGVDPEFAKTADEAVELPMLGEKESLNVSVTAGVVLYQDLLRRK